MSNIVQVKAFTHVGDRKRALAFFTDFLGFEVRLSTFQNSAGRRARRPATAASPITSTSTTSTCSTRS